MLLLRAEAPYNAFCAINLDHVVVVQPFQQSGHRNYGGNTQFTHHNRGMREQTSTLHQYSGSGRKEHDPSGIGVVRDQDTAGREMCISRVADDSHSATHRSGATTNATPLFARLRCNCVFLSI
jgi:hypothetical protein